MLYNLRINSLHLRFHSASVQCSNLYHWAKKCNKVFLTCVSYLMFLNLCICIACLHFLSRAFFSNVSVAVAWRGRGLPVDVAWQRCTFGVVNGKMVWEAGVRETMKNNTR